MNQNDNDTNSGVHIPTRVDQIHFDGLERTKYDILRELVKPILKSTDLNETLINVNIVRQRFYELGLFRSVQVKVDEIKDQKTSGGPTNVSVLFDVEETRRYAGGVFATGSNNEVSMTVELKSPNLLGRGEEIRGSYEHSLKYFSSWSASLSKPFIKPFWPYGKSNIDFTILQLSKHAPWSNYKELNRNLVIDFNIHPKFHHSHFLRWETSWRYLSELNSKPDFEIVEQFGHFLKSSLSHNYCYDNRDSHVLPTTGSLFKLYNEYAGFHKYGASFRKHEIELQHNISLLNLQFSFKSGMMEPLNNDGVPPIIVSDKFFLGGPMNLRGFQLNGIGPHGETGSSALGGLKYWVGGLRIHYPLPFKNAFKEYLRIQGFLNAGNISDEYNKLMENIRVSYGLGLIMSFGNNVRLEINYCFPLLSRKIDKLQRGLQFGIGINYV